MRFLFFLSSLLRCRASPPPPRGEQLAKHKAQHRSITLSQSIDPRPTFRPSDVVALLLLSVTSVLHLPGCWEFSAAAISFFLLFLTIRGRQRYKTKVAVHGHGQHRFPS